MGNKKGYVYLVGNRSEKNCFKIGMSKNEDKSRRLKQLQTGANDELYYLHTFDTNTPFKLEQMLHNHYKFNKVINEWYVMNSEDIKEFMPLCEEKQKIIDSMTDNPFFKRN